MLGAQGWTGLAGGGSLFIGGADEFQTFGGVFVKIFFATRAAQFYLLALVNKDEGFAHGAGEFFTGNGAGFELVGKGIGIGIGSRGVHAGHGATAGWHAAIGGFELGAERDNGNGSCGDGQQG